MAALNVGSGSVHCSGPPWYTHDADKPSDDMLHVAVALPTATKPGLHVYVQWSCGEPYVHTEHDVAMLKLSNVAVCD